MCVKESTANIPQIEIEVSRNYSESRIVINRNKPERGHFNSVTTQV